jgi:hypothetical protein
VIIYRRNILVRNENKGSVRDLMCILIGESLSLEIDFEAASSSLKVEGADGSV